MIFIITTFFGNIFLGIATARYGFKSNGMPGAFYALLTLSLSVFWTLCGIFFMPFENNWWGQSTFFMWNLIPFLPWIFLCRKKYRISFSGGLRLGFAGILFQSVFLAGVTYLALGENWLEALEYDISRYCGALLLLFAVPALLLNSLVFWFEKESWKCPNHLLAILAGAGAFFFFCMGLASLRVSV